MRKDRTFIHRFSAMGDEAEAMFESTCTRGFVRFGLDRPPIQVAMLPAQLRYTPDYLTSAGFVEVQGVGRDQILKLKVDKYEALLAWDRMFAADLFVWDSKNRRTTQFNIHDFPVTLCTLAEFAEGKPYYGLRTDDADFEWTEVDLGAF